MGFPGSDFLLNTELARELYHDVAADLPIIDFHNHLSPSEIASDRPYATITDLWLGDDHYKWKVMRTAGVPERLITGTGIDPAERFQAWAGALEKCLGNPVHVWAHMELRRLFGIEDTLDSKSAHRIYDIANRILAKGELSARRILRRFRVEQLCTTDDPTDDLAWHGALREDRGFSVTIRPTFRPDMAFAAQEPEEFAAWCDKLERAAQRPVRDLHGLVDALGQRLEHFISHGARMADHGLDDFHPYEDDDEGAERAVRCALAGSAPTDAETRALKAFLLYRLARLYTERGIIQQLHVGPLRNVNTNALRSIGRNAGFDIAGPSISLSAASRYFDRLESDGVLPRTLMFNLHPADSEPLAILAGAFPRDGQRAWVSQGPAWWFLDQIDGIEEQLAIFARQGVLATHIGMVTDSRSFASMTRHEYFRRTLCRFLGKLHADGLIPDDTTHLASIVRAICHDNAYELMEEQDLK